MKKSIRLKAFESFYHKTYKQTLNYFLERTGDFVNAEEILERIYSEVYHYYLKSKVPVNDQAEACLQKHTKRLIKRNLKMRKKDKIVALPQKENAVASALEHEYALDEVIVEKKMLRQEILSLVSQKDVLNRRLFAYVFFFGKTIDDAADSLRISTDVAKKHLYELILDIERLCADFEQDV